MSYNNATADNVTRIAIRMADETTANGGATYVAVEESRGEHLATLLSSLAPLDETDVNIYIVGGVAGEKIVPNNPVDIACGITVYAIAHAENLRAGRGVGTWLNKSTGMVHIDIVEPVSGLTPATILAGLRGELAIYHPASSKSITLAD